jgi:hypothetical protein
VGSQLSHPPPLFFFQSCVWGGSTLEWWRRKITRAALHCTAHTRQWRLSDAWRQAPLSATDGGGDSAIGATIYIAISSTLLSRLSLSHVIAFFVVQSFIFFLHWGGEKLSTSARSPTDGWILSPPLFIQFFHLPAEICVSDDKWLFNLFRFEFVRTVDLSADNKLIERKKRNWMSCRRHPKKISDVMENAIETNRKIKT